MPQLPPARYSDKPQHLHPKEMGLQDKGDTDQEGDDVRYPGGKFEGQLNRQLIDWHFQKRQKQQYQNVDRQP